MLYGLVDDQQLVLVCAVFLLGQVDFLEKPRGCQAFWTRSCSRAPMENVETSARSESAVDELGCASTVAHDKIAFHSSEALWSSGVQVIK
jgi:hypothetical protein